MSSAAISTRAALSPSQELYRFSVAQYMTLIDEGVFGTDVRTELIDGLVVRKMTRNSPHDSTLGFLNRWFSRQLSDEWDVRCQLGLVLARSVPEPDLLIARGPAEKYRDRHPRGTDTFLVIEVAEDSLDSDRRDKGPVYAGARIPEYWIVNVVDFQVEVYTQPRAGKTPGYRHRQDFTSPANLPLLLDGQALGEIPIAKVFGGLLPH
jgi:Uma2 family endonuclease